MDDSSQSNDQRQSRTRSYLGAGTAMAVIFAILLALGAHKLLAKMALQFFDGEGGTFFAALALGALVVLLGVAGHGLASLTGMDQRERVNQAASMAQRQRYQGLLNSIDAGTIICRPHMDGAAFSVADLNTSAELLTGVTRFQALDACPTTLFPSQHANALRELCQRVWQTGVPVTLGAMPYIEDERQRWHTYQAFKVVSGEVVLAFEDITAQQDAENERQLLSAVVQQMQDALIVMDHRGRIVYVNEAFETLYGYGRNEVLGQPGPDRLIDPENPESRVSLAMANNLSKGLAWNGEYQVRRQDGQMLWVHGTHCPVRVGVDQPSFWFSIVHDVTERREIEQRFRQVTKMEAIGQLAGGIAHDFNNLLTVINGYSQMALMTLDEDAPDRDDFCAIAQAGERAAALVQQLLAFSRRQVMRMESVQLNEQIVAMDRILKSLIPDNVVLSMDLASALGTVEADPTQIEQVIINLVANACDAMPDGGDLLIQTRQFEMTDEFITEHDGAQLGSYALLEVADTGTGIAPEILDHIFEPFYTTKEMGNGTGLGLSTVYGIVKQSQGYVYVDTEVGVGTTFGVYMPLSENGEEELQGPTLRGPMSGGTETLLIAEDEAIVRYVTAHFMMRLGYRVLTANSGREALALYDSHAGPIDMLIADVIMPEMNGSELARELVARQPDLAVLLVTGYSDHVIETRADISAHAQVLRKPFDQHDLAKIVREALDARLTFRPRGS